MPRLYLLLLLFTPTLRGLTQRQGQSFVDSLTREISRPKARRDQVVLIYSIGKAYSSINLDSAFAYSRRALFLAQQAKWTKSEGKSYTLTGLILFYKGDYAAARKYYDTAIGLSQQAKDTANWNMTLLNIGAVLNVEGSYAKAMQYFVQCLALDDQRHDNSNRAIALQNISNVYMQLKDTAKAIDYSVHAYAAYKAAGDLQGMALSLYTRGVIYDSQGKDSTALTCYQQSAALCRQGNNDIGIVRALNGEGSLHLKKDELGAALGCFFRGLALCRRLGLKYETAVLSLNCGQIYLQAVVNNKYDLPSIGENPPVDKRAAYLRTARGYLFEAFDINRAGRFDALKDNLLAISKWDSLTGNYLGALTAYEQYTLLQDSTFSTDNRQTIRELEGQHQLDIRDQQIRINQLELSRNQLAISRQNTQRWMYIGGILLLGAIGGLLLRQNRQRKLANTTLRGLNTELDQANQVKTRLFGVLSHDLRSPIANLISFLNLQKENPELLEPARAEQHRQEINRSAANLLDTMEDLLLWSKEQMRNFPAEPRFITIGNLFTEMRSLYPDTENCRIEFDCPPHLELQTEENFLKTILRNLTTNAIKSAPSPNGHIHWKAWTFDSQTCLSISDNGPGISQQARDTLLAHITTADTNTAATTNGLGLHLIREFATAIGCRISIDSTPGDGTRISLTFG
jgi:signal transduction histidine kinase